MSLRTIHVISCAAAVVVGGLTAHAAAGDSVLLKPKLETPARTYIELDNDVEQRMTGPDGKPMEVASRTLLGLNQTSTPKGQGVEFEATLDRMLSMMAFGPSMKSLHDTDDAGNEESSPQIRDTIEPLLNMVLVLSVDGEGNATSVKGADEIRKKLKAMGDSNFTASMLADGSFTDARVGSALGETPFALYPMKEVKVGDSWKKSGKDEVPNVGLVLLSYDCKLDRVDKKNGREIAVVTYKGTMEKDPTEKATKEKPLGKIKGTFDGTAVFDIEQGMFVEDVRKTDAKLEVPNWWQRDESAPLIKIDSKSRQTYIVATAADRQKRKDEIAKQIAETEARRAAEEAAAMAGPVEPTTASNPPVAWTQWGGPNRNFVSDATGLANRWPKGGPPKLWERELGDAYSCIVTDGDTLYTMYSIRDKAYTDKSKDQTDQEKENALKGDEVVVALDAKTGKTLWEHKYPAPWTKDLQMEFGPGPHSTPLLMGDRLFTVGATAKLLCLDKKSGKVIWSKDLLEEFKAGLHMRGYGSSPLAYKDTILLPVSKEKGLGVIAFKQSDGSIAWKGGEFEPGYASLLVIDADGVEQLVAFTGKAVLGLEPGTGNSLWSVEHPTQWGANISTPIWGAEDDHLFISSAYGMGSRGVKLEKAGSQIAAKEVWFNPKMKIQHGDAVRVGDWIYGSSGDFGPTFLACVNAKTGEFGWKQRGITKANVLYADGKLIVLDEDGTLLMVKADPTKYRVLGKVTGLCKKEAWTAPTLVGRTLFVRDRHKIMALDLGASKENS